MKEEGEGGGGRIWRRRKRKGEGIRALKYTHKQKRTLWPDSLLQIM